MTELKKTPLYDLHVSLGAKMTAFAGYDMPVQYKDGVLKEHLHTREKAGLFDVSHMGQGAIVASDYETAALALERVAPGEILKLKPGRQRYTVLLNEQGGVLDDLIVAHPAQDGRVNFVVNAACKDDDFAYMQAQLPQEVSIERYDDRALLALQGPEAAAVLSALAPEASALKFMELTDCAIEGIAATISRSGYTGEDGFEISIANKDATALAQKLLSDERVAPIGLGARDSLRLEAGLCLYGHDLSPETSPVEGSITFAIGKRRRREADFPGAARVLRELEEGPARRLVGIKPEGRAPAREGVEIQSEAGEAIGVVTSGGFGPTAGGPVAMGYVQEAHSAVGTKVNLIIRGKAAPGEIVQTPFVPHRYYRG